jgi:hypothetical protein
LRRAMMRGATAGECAYQTLWGEMFAAMSMILAAEREAAGRARPPCSMFRPG